MIPKKILDYVLGYFKKGMFSITAEDADTKLTVKYCNTIKYHSSDDTVSVSTRESGGQLEVDFKVNSGVSISLDIHQDTFTGLNTGNTVILTNTPVAWQDYLFVFRNGVFQSQGIDFTVAGTTLTFATNFGTVSGGAGNEQVDVMYFK